ncbi:MAG: glycosyltransferase [Candidatus Hodarchaeota archaeon]
MRILHVIPDLQIGGAQSLVVNLIKNINPKIFDVRLCVLYPSFNTRLDYELLKKEIPVYYLSKHKGIDLRMIGRLSRVLNNFRPDIIHTHMYIMRYTLIPMLLNRIPIRIHTLHTLAQHEVDFAGKIVQRVAFNFFNFMPISVSNNVDISVKKVYNVSSIIIYNGISVDYFDSLKKPCKRKKNETIFINVSGFRPVKNHHLLINALNMVVKVRQHIKLYLIGDGPLRPEIEKMVAVRNLQNNIIFLGIRDNIQELLKKSDVYVVSSKYEGQSLSVMEAMLAGKPIISTGVEGMLDLVENEITGILVPPNDTEALATAMIKLTDRIDLRKKMGKKGKERVVKRFNIKNTSESYENLYIDLYRQHYRVKCR